MKLLNQVNNTYYKNMSDAQICKFIWAVVEEERTRNQEKISNLSWNTFDAIFEYKTKTEDQRVEIHRLEEEIGKNRVEIVEMEQDIIDREDENAMMVDQLAAALRAEEFEDLELSTLSAQKRMSNAERVNDDLHAQLERLNSMVETLWEERYDS